MTLRSILILSAAALVITGGTSCTQEYTCHCSIKYSGQPGLPDSTVQNYSIRDKKANAKSLCEDRSKHTEANGIKTDEDCSLF